MGKEKLDVEFFAVETSIFALQTAVLFLVGYFGSYMFTNEQKFIELVNSRVSSLSVNEFMITMLVLVFCFGVVALAYFFTPISAFQRVLRELVSEFPRTVYLFGSNLSALGLLMYAYACEHPGVKVGTPEKYLKIAVFFAVAFLFIGIGFKCLIVLRGQKNIEW